MDTSTKPAETEQPKEARVHINVNLDGLLGSLHRDVQRVTNLVAVGIQSPVVLDEESLAIRSDPIAFRFGNAPPWTSGDDARSDYQDWVYGNGLRDVLESVGSFLEEVRQVLALWSLGDRQSAGERLTGASWNAEMKDAAKRFHRLGFPDKVETLRTAFGVQVEAVLNEHVLAANNARNCLVHRRGIVSERDLNHGKVLVVSWRRMAVELQDEDGQHPLVFGKALEKDSTVVMSVVDTTKEFGLGERVIFTATEFAEICWSMYLYSFAWGETLNQLGLKRGYIAAPACAPS